MSLQIIQAEHLSVTGKTLSTKMTFSLYLYKIHLQHGLMKVFKRESSSEHPRSIILDNSLIEQPGQGLHHYVLHTSCTDNLS